MDLGLTKEQRILFSSARDFLKKECPRSLVREMKDDERGYPPQMWKKMADLGWTGVAIPEQYGGTGGSFLDLCLLLEAMGEVCAPGPFFTTTILGGQTLLDAGSEDQKRDLLPKIADGKAVLTLAMIEPGAWYGAAGVAAGAEADGDHYLISGTKLFVENAHFADYILCVARTDPGKGPKGGLTLFLVDAKSPGITCTPLRTLAYDKQCEMVLDRVRVPAGNVVGQVNQAWDLLERLEEKAAVGKCAEMVGTLQAVLDMTVAYAKARKQFERPIGSFQAVQHHCANMVLDTDGSRFISYQAAWKISEGMSAAMEAAMAKAWTSSAARRVTILAHQIHGAISFTEEYDVHLYYRRAKAAEVAFGDTDYHLEKVAGHLGL